MKRITRVLIVRLVMLAALMLPGCITAVRIDISGLWTGEMIWTDGPATGFATPLSLDVVQEGGQVGGVVILSGPGAQSFNADIFNGRVSGHSVEIDASGVNDLIDPPVNVSVSLDGEATETVISGTGSQTMGSETYHFTWSVQFVAPPPEAPEPSS